MVQVLAAKVPVAAGVWVEAKDRAEVEWVDHSRRERVEIVSAQVADKLFLMLPGSLAMQ